MNKLHIKNKLTQYNYIHIEIYCILKAVWNTPSDICDVSWRILENSLISFGVNLITHAEVEQVQTRVVCTLLPCHSTVQNFAQQICEM